MKTEKVHSKKLKSTTLWLAIISVALIPLSWITEYFFKLRFLHYMVENNLDPNQLNELFITIPMGPIVTLATFAISIYGARRAGREITTNLQTGNNSMSVTTTKE